MKKILFLILCIFSMKEVHASTLNYENLPYYVLINDEVIQVKKISDEKGNALFNVDYKNYNLNGDFHGYSEVNKVNFGLYFRNLHIFNTVTYYAYQNKNDLNYYLTQVFVWNNVRNAFAKICDSEGNIINNYDKEYQKLNSNIFNHNLNANFINRTYSSEIWSNKTFTYYDNNIILDNPFISGLKFSNEDSKLNIYNELVGEYTIVLTKNFERNNLSYTDGVNYYWANLGGPADLEKKFYYNVYGTKINIKENLIGINNKVGDASLNSDYELYLDDELKLTFDNFNNLYVKSNSNYLVKDVSDNKSVNNIEDFNFFVNEEEFELVIDKYVVSKNISISINDNKTYYVYLKSNDELYEEINSSTNLITLPFGVYYVTDKDNYYEEIEVLNDIDDILIIDNKVIEEDILKEEVKDNIIVDEIIEEDNNLDISENTKEDNLIDIIVSDNVSEDVYFDEVIENPKTGYSYNLFSILMFVILLPFGIFLSIKKFK